LVVSRRPVGKVGETHCVFPGLSIGDRACAVRRGSAQPTVHKFTAPAWHGVRRPVPSQPLIGRGKPRPVYASRAPDADAADCTNRRTRQGCASVRCRWPPESVTIFRGRSLGAPDVVPGEVHMLPAEWGEM